MHSEHMANTDDSRSLSDIFARSARTINPASRVKADAKDYRQGQGEGHGLTSLKTCTPSF